MKKHYLLTDFLLKFFTSKRKYYGHIISLGYNCEVSFQFFKKYHFTESSLFAWCCCPSIKTMINAINNLKSVGSGDIRPQAPMWLCQNSNILFHGKGNPKEWQNPSPEFLENDLKELKSRLTHLREKFIRTGKDGKNNLYIYKCTPEESVISPKELTEYINALHNAIKTLCSNTFDLLIILEKDKQVDIEKEIKEPNIFVRRVNFFTKETRVTSKPYDKRNWSKIFSEFRPNFKLPKNKHYKFEAL